LTLAPIEDLLERHRPAARRKGQLMLRESTDRRYRPSRFGTVLVLSVCVS